MTARPQCPECDDAGESLSCALRPFCRVVGAPVDEETYECYCACYPHYRTCERYRSSHDERDMS